MAGWATVDDIGVGLSNSERAILRKRHERRRSQSGDTHQTLVDEYMNFLSQQFDAPDDMDKKSKICVILRAFGKTDRRALSEAVDCSTEYLGDFRACGSTNGKNGQRIDLYPMSGADHEKGVPYVVVQRIRRSSSLEPETHEKVFMRDGNECRRCGATDNLEIHHIVPASRGGRSEMENLATLCKDCHNDAAFLGAHRQLMAYPPGKFEAWIKDDLNICGALTARKKRCQNPPESCPHH